MFHTRSRALRLTVCAGAVVAATAGSAQAMVDGSGAYPGPEKEPFSRPCFMVQAHWNVALDGPQPLCPGPRR
jgi:hypothetical protein